MACTLRREKKKIVLGCFSLVLLLAASAYADETYRCECIGIVKGSEYLPYCGNGFNDSNRYTVKTGLKASSLPFFQTGALLKKLLETGEIQYCTVSGWQCEPE